MIFKLVVRLAQTMHLSYVKITTVSKQIEMSIYLSLVTYMYHQVRPKWFLSLWYVWCKPCTYLALTLTLSSNIPKRDSTWRTSLTRSIGCVQNDFWAYGTFDANHAPILHQDWHYFLMDRIKFPLEPRHLGVPSGASKLIAVLMVRLAQNVHLPCTDTNIVSKRTKIIFHMTHVTLEFYRLCSKWFLSHLCVWRKPCTYVALRLTLSINKLKRASTWASSLLVFGDWQLVTRLPRTVFDGLQHMQNSMVNAQTMIYTRITWEEY
jgi:hypothetical protein